MTSPEPLTKRGLVNGVCVMAVVGGIALIAIGAVVAIATAIDGPSAPGSFGAIVAGVVAVIIGLTFYRDADA